MMLKTFPKGGVHPPENKFSSGNAIEVLPLPKTVSIPISQHIGAPATPVVQKNDMVKTGQVIARSSGFVSANIHSSVSGKVVKVDKSIDSSGYRKMSVIIEVEGDEWDENIDRSADLKKDIETLDLNIKCRPTLAWSSIFQPYPGTELGALFPNISVDSISDNFYDDTVLNISQRKQRLRLQKLFGLISHFPWLRFFLPVLLNLKLDKLYKKLWQWNNRRADKVLYRGILS